MSILDLINIYVVYFFICSYSLVCHIIGDLDFNDNHSEIVSNIDDFLWVKISQVLAQDLEMSTTSHRESLTLNQLQTLLYETYGMSYYFFKKTVSLCVKK